MHTDIIPLHHNLIVSSGYSFNHAFNPPVKTNALDVDPDDDGVVVLGVDEEEEEAIESKASWYHPAHLGPRPLDDEQ